MNKNIIVGTLVLSFGSILLAIASPTNGRYEAYYLYLGNYPSNASPGWHESAQGLTHDRDNWFITQQNYLWRIPVTHDLSSVSPSAPGVRRIDRRDIPQLKDFNHFGDPDYYEFEGQGFVIVPLEHLDDHKPCSAFGVFRADSLDYVAFECLPEQAEGPWVAVDPQGNMYSSNSKTAKVNKYSVDWLMLRNEQRLILKSEPPLDLLDEQGNSVTLNSFAGGVISPSGQLLYIVADGIHVFDLSTGRRVQRSTNDSGYFSFEFDDSFFVREEPEGITIWDLDDGRAPGITGQLHALLLDNDIGDDNVYLKHYTGTIYVDHNHNGAEQGTPSNPFKTVAKAYNLAWDGAQIKIRGGSYPETLTFSKRIKVLGERGPAIIGQ
jgi:hypothetical protein